MKEENDEVEEEEEEAFHERSSPFYPFHFLSTYWGGYFSPLIVSPPFLFLLFSFSFKSLLIHVILRFLAEKFTGYGKNPHAMCGTHRFALDLMKQNP